MIAKLRAWWDGFKLFLEAVWLFAHLPEDAREQELSKLKERHAAPSRKKNSSGQTLDLRPNLWP